MQRCPKCGGNFSERDLVDVVIQRGGSVTRQLMCEPCGLEATRGLNQMILQGDGRAMKDAAALVEGTARQYVSSGVHSAPPQSGRQIYLAPPGGQRQGPFSIDQINADLATGKYKDDEFWAWHEGLNGWIPLHSVSGVRVRR